MELLQQSVRLVYRRVEITDKKVTSLQQYIWSIAADVALLL